MTSTLIKHAIHFLSGEPSSSRIAFDHATQAYNEIMQNKKKKTNSLPMSGGKAHAIENSKKASEATLLSLNDKIREHKHNVHIIHLSKDFTYINTSIHLLVYILLSCQYILLYIEIKNKMHHDYKDTSDAVSGSQATLNNIGVLESEFKRIQKMPMIKHNVPKIEIDTEYTVFSYIYTLFKAYTSQFREIKTLETSEFHLSQSIENSKNTLMSYYIQRLRSVSDDMGRSLHEMCRDMTIKLKPILAERLVEADKLMRASTVPVLNSNNFLN